MVTRVEDTRLRILIADDHPSIRENLRYFLDAEVDLRVIGVASDGVSALRMVLSLRPDVLLIEYELPDYDGLSVARVLREKGSAARVVLYTMSSRIWVDKRRLEVDACVRKDASTTVLLDAIRRSSRPVPRDRPRVLVVEDDAEVRGVIRAALEEDDLEIIETGDGFEALAECERQAPGVVVLDLGLPNMSGQEFVNAYRQLKIAKAPIVVLSANSNGRQIAGVLGAAAYVAKPFSLEELSQAVRGIALVERNASDPHPVH
jgi:CheY-like chemotaxis protein